MDIVERLRHPFQFSDALYVEAADEIERLRKALEWIAGCEGGDIFDLWKEMRDTARAALQQKDGE